MLETHEVINTFYTKQGSPIEYHWERLPESFHGSGCTLSSRIAAQLALGNDLKTSGRKSPRIHLVITETWAEAWSWASST